MVESEDKALFCITRNAVELPLLTRGLIERVDLGAEEMVESSGAEEDGIVGFLHLKSRQTGDFTALIAEQRLLCTGIELPFAFPSRWPVV